MLFYQSVTDSSCESGRRQLQIARRIRRARSMEVRGPRKVRLETSPEKPLPASEVVRPELEPLSADETQKDDPGRATRADRAAYRALPGRTETDRTRTHARLSAAESSAEVGNLTHLAT